MLWVFSVPRRVAAGAMEWVSVNPLATVGAVLALLASGRLYGLLRDTGGLTGPPPTGLVPSVALDVAVAHPAYVLAVLVGTLSVVFFRG